jgi:hypothetical protein
MFVVATTTPSSPFAEVMIALLLWDVAHLYWLANAPSGLGAGSADAIAAHAGPRAKRVARYAYTS